MVLTGSPNQNPYPRQVFRLPVWLWIWGIPALAACGAFTARIVWEETVWTWSSGPQMIGFSLIHGSGAILVLSPLLLFPFLIVLVVMIVRSLVKGRSILGHVWVMLGLTVVVLGALFLPYGIWQRVFADKLAKGSYAGEFMVYAAATGDLETVKALVSHGVPINSPNRSGQTALHGAAVAGQFDIIQFLVSRGADINALDRYGDSPLEAATSAGKTQAAQFLTSHGAKRVRGDEAQRQKATQDIVREDMEKMERGRHP